MHKHMVALGFALSSAFGCGRGGSAAEVRASPVAAPSTDIYLYRIGASGSFRGALINITNRGGYDNQPSFDGPSVLYTSERGGQTDIYRYTNGNRTQLTATPESEYSPAMTPDGSAISVVRVERDSTQRLWRFPSDNSSPAVVLEHIAPVGYYAWLDSTTVALFVLGNPSSLQVADTRTGATWVVARDVGRSLQRVPQSRRGSFLLRSGAGWKLALLDPTDASKGSFSVDTIATMPDSAAYVVWRSPTEVYTAAGSRILRMRLPEGSWTPLADLSNSGLHHITRIALSPDGTTLALVAEEH